jgi:hypothetical protein
MEGGNTVSRGGREGEREVEVMVLRKGARKREVEPIICELLLMHGPKLPKNHQNQEMRQN